MISLLHSLLRDDEAVLIGNRDSKIDVTWDQYLIALPYGVQQRMFLKAFRNRFGDKIGIGNLSTVFLSNFLRSSAASETSPSMVIVTAAALRELAAILSAITFLLQVRAICPPVLDAPFPVESPHAPTQLVS